MYNELAKHLKPLSAEEDSNFRDHFISTKYSNRILTDESDIIFGTKGSGKTALSITLTDFHKDIFLTTLVFNLNTLSFHRLLNNLNKLKDNVNEDINIVSRIAWKNALLNQSILAASKCIDDADLKHKIVSILNEDGFIKNDEDILDSDAKVTSVLENLFNQIKDALFTHSPISTLASQQANVINKFPLNQKTSDILDELISTIKSTGKKILVSVDGLDSIADHSFESRNVIFTGLIDAIYHLRINKKLNEAFIFKAFLPQELTIDAKIKIWDSDKHLHNTHYINWDKSALKEFIKRRFVLKSKLTNGSFQEAWLEFMPEKIINPVYNVEEYSFDYILRHTLYRPRQLQNHIYVILQRWIETTGGHTKIQPSFIPKIISENNVILAEQVAGQQLSKIYPNFIQFLKSWNKSSTSVNAGVFRDRISRYFGSDYKIVNQLFDEFYIFGIFGIAIDDERPDFLKKSKKFHYSYVNDRIISSIHDTVNESDLIAFAPMFRKYCGLKRKNGYLLDPVNYDDYA